MNMFCCCLDEKNEFQDSSIPEIRVFDVSASISTQYECKTESEDEENVTHTDFFLPINNSYYKNIVLHKPKPIRKIPTIDNLLQSNDPIPALPKRSEPIPIDHNNRYL